MPSATSASRAATPSGNICASVSCWSKPLSDTSSSCRYPPTISDARDIKGPLLPRGGGKGPLMSLQGSAAAERPLDVAHLGARRHRALRHRRAAVAEGGQLGFEGVDLSGLEVAGK